jgi:hypothetical protein
MSNQLISLLFRMLRREWIKRIKREDKVDGLQEKVIVFYVIINELG